MARPGPLPDCRGRLLCLTKIHAHAVRKLATTSISRATTSSGNTAAATLQTLSDGGVAMLNAIMNLIYREFLMSALAGAHAAQVRH